MSEIQVDQPHRAFWARGLAALKAAKRCGAKRRCGLPCQAPAMPNGRCRIHGGRSPGAPRGERNGNWRSGFYSQDAVANRRRVQALIGEMRRTLKDDLS